MQLLLDDQSLPCNKVKKKKVYPLGSDEKGDVQAGGIFCFQQISTKAHLQLFVQKVLYVHVSN